MLWLFLTLVLSLTYYSEAQLATRGQSRLNSKGLRLLRNATCGVFYTPEAARRAFPSVSHGKKVELFNFPWMALLKYSEGPRFQCGGTLISDRYVLTAAHCLNEFLIEVRLGEHNITSDPDCTNYGEHLVCTGPIEDIGIEKAIKHYGYNSNFDNDIALLRLNRQVEFKNHIRPICLPLTPEQRSNVPKNYIISGWGLTETGIPSDVPMWTPVLHRSRHTCETAYKLKNMLDESVICAGGENLMDSCRGDSGGPIVLDTLNIENRYIQVGIISVGLKSCGQKNNFPGLFTNISHYMPWVTDTMDL